MKKAAALMMLVSGGRASSSTTTAAAAISFRMLFSSSAAANCKLFVGGLSYTVDEKSLKDAFSSFGPVDEVKIIYDKDSGRSRGFGFVHFSKQDDAVSAKDAMDGKALLGRPLRISFALERVRGGPLVVPRLPTK